VVFSNWFGKEDLSLELGIEIIKEIDELNKLFNQTIENENVLLTKERFELIDKLISKKGFIKRKNIFAINKKIKNILEEIIKGKLLVRDSFKFILIYQMYKDLNEDDLFKKLADLFSKEKEVSIKFLKNQNNELEHQLNQIYKQEKKIINALKIISEAELNETHMHFSASVDVNFHFEYLEKNWKKGVKENCEKYSKTNKEGKVRIFPEDYIKLDKIMNNFFKKKITRYEGMIELEKLLFMTKENHKYFRDFLKKAELLNAIYETVGKKPTYEFIEEGLRAMAKHNINHNINYIEMRYPIRTKEEYYLFSKCAKKIEEGFDNKIKIRFIVYACGFNEDKIKESIQAYKEFSKEYDGILLKKYFVAFDDNTQSLLRKIFEHKDIDLLRESPLSVVIHAGEFYSKEDIGFENLNAYERLEKSLNQIQTCLRTKNIKRIGHANILSENIEKYLKNFEYEDGKTYTEEEINKFVKLQDELKKSIQNRGIIIEANPTSNLLIAGFEDYSKHPIKTFDENKINYSISTDDRIIFNTNLRKEFYLISDAMNWEEKELRKAIKMTQDAKLENN
jgi:adenosine deaminase